MQELQKCAHLEKYLLRKESPLGLQESSLAVKVAPFTKVDGRSVLFINPVAVFVQFKPFFVHFYLCRFLEVAEFRVASVTHGHFPRIGVAAIETKHEEILFDEVHVNHIVDKMVLKHRNLTDPSVRHIVVGAPERNGGDMEEQFR